MTAPTPTIEGLMHERRRFAPPQAFTAHANARDPAIYARAAQDLESFWAQEARELHWDAPWTHVLEWLSPHAKWFVNGKLNASVNCVDRHLATRAAKRAIIWEGEPGEVRTITYRELHEHVCRFANALKRLGVQKGDRVGIYLPMVPEAAVAMLACARIGAIHSVVFGGFSAASLRDRMNDAQAKVLVTANGAYRRGHVLDLKANADEALQGTPSIEHVVVVQRIPERVTYMREGRDHWWHDLCMRQPPECTPTPMDAEDPLFTLYTSGTTGKPKGVLHTTGGYLVGVYATTKYVLDVKDDDVYFCTADVGWVTGHSYIVYGPLANGATVVMYEGAPDWPDKDRFWDMVARHRATIFYTAPTAIRAFMKCGPEYPAKHDLTSLRLLGSVGEPINPEAWMWYYEHIGGGRCPIVDTWWQTETGMILISTLPGIDEMKPGSAGKPFPGLQADIVDEHGKPVPDGNGGYLVLKTPWPAMLRTVWGDPERYVQTYWSKFKPDYFAGDGAKRDDNGYYTVLGRVDDVMNVAGHRISTMEVESALVDHPAVAEAAVIGRHDDMKGQGIVAYVILRAGHEPTEALRKNVREHVGKVISPIAKPDVVAFVPDLPKTRSGKIMRRLLRDIAEDRALGDVTTLADPSVVEKIKAELARR